MIAKSCADKPRALLYYLVNVWANVAQSHQVENKVVKKRILNDPVTYPEKFSESARSICEGLLCKEVDKRLGFKNGSCDELRAHPYFNQINWMKLNSGQLLAERRVQCKSCQSLFCLFTFQVLCVYFFCLESTLRYSV